MALTDKDITLFKFLRSAIDFKHRAGNWEKENFLGIPFDPWINFWTQRVFLARKLPQYVNLFKDRKVFEELYKNLGFKPELQFLNNPQLVKEAPQEQPLPQDVHNQIAKEASSVGTAAVQQVYGPSQSEKAAEQSRAKVIAVAADQAARAGEPTATMIGGVPSANIGQSTRVVHDIPPAKPPAEAAETSPSKIYIANKSRTVAETPPSKSELVAANKSGVVTEKPPSTIFIADKSGKVVGEHPIPSSAPQRFNLASFKSSLSSTFSKMQNFTSRAGIFFQRNVGKFFTVGRIGTAISAGIGAVAGLGFGPIGALAGGAAGGIGSFWIRSGEGVRFLGGVGNGAINAWGRFSNQVSGGTTRLAAPSKKLVWALLLGLFFFVFGAGLLGGLTGTTPSGEAAPITPTAQIIPMGEGAEKIASAAKQIAEQLVDSVNPGMAGCDPSGTFGPGYHCWKEMTSYDQAGDPGYLQCTEFVWAVFDKAGFVNEINLIRNNNAADWPKAAQNYPQIFSVFGDARQLLPGDIISLGGKPTGQDSGVNSHLAIVIEKGENVVRVAQAATDSPLESWDIDTATGELNPLKEAHPQTRMYVQGFIRLISKL